MRTVKNWVFDFKLKKLNFAGRNMLISWGIYTFALILSNLNYHMPGFNCFQDDLLVFVVYFLYYFPNKNIIYDNQYIYSRLLSSKKVFLYYLKIYLKSSLVYFFGINIINLLYCFIAGKELFMWGFISYIAYGFATFMIYNILSAILLSKWNVKYIMLMVISWVCLTYLLNMFVENFYLIGFPFYCLSAPNSAGYIPFANVALTYSVCLLILSVLWLMPSSGHAKPLKSKINFRKYMPLYFISISSAAVCVMFLNAGGNEAIGKSSFYFDLLSYNYNSLIKCGISNIDIQLIIGFSAVLCFCTFFFISNKYEERKLMYMLAHRYQSRKNLMRYTVITSARLALQALGIVLANFALWAAIFGRCDFDIRILCAYIIYAARMYLVLFSMTLLISTVMLSKNSGVSFFTAFAVFYIVFIFDIMTQNIAIICLDYSLINSVCGFFVNILVATILMCILNRQIYKAEI